MKLFPGYLSGYQPKVNLWLAEYQNLGLWSCSRRTSRKVHPREQRGTRQAYELFTWKEKEESLNWNVVFRGYLLLGPMVFNLENHPRICFHKWPDKGHGTWIEGFRCTFHRVTTNKKTVLAARSTTTLTTSRFWATRLSTRSDMMPSQRTRSRIRPILWWPGT